MQGLYYFVVLNISLTLMLLLWLHLVLTHIRFVHGLVDKVVRNGWNDCLVVLSLVRFWIDLNVTYWLYNSLFVHRILVSFIILGVMRLILIFEPVRSFLVRWLLVLSRPVVWGCVIIIDGFVLSRTWILIGFIWGWVWLTLILNCYCLLIWTWILIINCYQFLTTVNKFALDARTRIWYPLIVRINTFFIIFFIILNLGWAFSFLCFLRDHSLLLRAGSLLLKHCLFGLLFIQVIFFIVDILSLNRIPRWVISHFTFR